MRTLLALIVTIAFSVPLFAQEAPPTCTSVDVNTAVISMMADLSSLQIAGLNEDIPATLSAITTLRATLDQLERACAPHSESPSPAEQPLVFVGDGQRVMGPFSIPSGVYRVIATCAGYCYPTLERLTGTCGSVANATSLPWVSRTGGTGEDVFRSSGCSAMLEVAGEDWRIEFALIQ